MQQITQVMGYPNGTPIDAVQGRLVAVYPIKPTAKGSVQKAELSDVGGNKLRLTVWDHPDLTEHKDGEFVLHSSGNSKFPSLKVVHGSYVAQKDGRSHKAGDTVKTIELSVSKTGVFQHVHVYNANKGVQVDAAACDVKVAGSPIRQEIIPDRAVAVQQSIHGATVGIQQTGIHGAKVGMAINCATQLIVALSESTGSFPSKSDIVNEIDSIASKLITLSNRLESGVLFKEKQNLSETKDTEEDRPF